MQSYDCDYDVMLIGEMFTMIKRKNYIIFYGIAISFLIFLAICKRYDLLISIELYNKKSIFGLIFQIFGQWPTFAVFLFSVTYLFMTRQKENKLQNVGEFIGWGLSIIVGAFCIGVTPVAYILKSQNIEPPKLTTLLIPVVIIISALLVKKLKVERHILMRKTAITIAIYFYVTALVAYGIKIPWGRLRFRDMQQPFNEFTVWYLPQGFTDNYSFASGHVMSACFWLLLVSVSTRISPRLFSKEKLLYLLAIGWIVCVAVSRIIYGAHFASDVTMGAILGVTIFLILKKTRIEQEL